MQSANPQSAMLPLSRREMLQRMGTGLGSLGLATVLADNGLLAAEGTTQSPLAPRAPQFKPKAKRLIHLFMNGGPSHVDTFDPKPGLEKYNGQKAPEYFTKESSRRNISGTMMRSPFKFSKYGKSGLEVSEIYPKIGSCIDDICVIRSMHTNIPNHEPALLMMTCGDTQPVRPSMGSWMLYGLGTENQNLPGFVVLCPGKPVVGPALWSNSFLPGIFQGAHIGGKIDPRSSVPHVNNPYLGRGAQREQMDLLKQMNEAHLAKRGGDNPLEARIQSLEMAFRMQFEAQDAFDLNKESAATREQYGKTQFADACLASRRLVERGVRMVQVFYGGGQPWDDHGDIMGHQQKAKDSDQAIAALLMDLKQRGLLDETIVLWGGEFGRTPTSQGAKGRDHHSTGFTVWMAGGGVKGGMAYGSTDEFGFDAVENRMHVHDLHATILHLMGMDHEKLTYRYGGRDFRLTDVYGTVHKGIIA